MSIFDVAAGAVFLTIAVFIYKKSWFYSFYSFAKFIIVALLSFWVGIILTKATPVNLPVNTLSRYLIFQILIFIILWRILSFKGLFFRAAEKIFNLDRLIFTHGVNRFLSIIPSAVAALYITFFLLTSAVSASTPFPYIQKAIEESKIVKPILYKIYFANLNESGIFENIAYKLVPNINGRQGLDLKQLPRQAVESFLSKINVERTVAGLRPIGTLPGPGLPEIDKENAGGGAGVFYPPPPPPSLEPKPTATSIPFKRIPTATPVPQTNAPYVSPPLSPSAKPLIPTLTPTPIPTPIPQPPPFSINQAEQDIFRLTNMERAKNGIPPLSLIPEISAVARAHSQDMVARNFFSHINPDGLDPFARLSIGGISYGKAAENIAGGPTPEIIITNWMNSPGHRQAILNPSYRKIGVGVAQDSKFGIIATQDFTD